MEFPICLEELSRQPETTVIGLSGNQVSAVACKYQESCTTVRCSLFDDSLSDQAQGYLSLGEECEYTHTLIGYIRHSRPRPHYHLLLGEALKIGVSLSELVDEPPSDVYLLAKKLVEMLEYMQERGFTLSEDVNVDDLFYLEEEGRLTLIQPYLSEGCLELYKRSCVWAVGVVWEIYSGTKLDELWEMESEELGASLLDRILDEKEVNDSELLDLLLGLL